MGTTLNTYRLGETVEVTGTITDNDNVAANPSVSTVTRIADPGKTVQAEAETMTSEVTGLYFFAYDIPVNADVGKWTYEVIATDGAGADVSIGSGSFVVKARDIAPV